MYRRRGGVQSATGAPAAPPAAMSQQDAGSPVGLRLSCSPEVAAALRAASRLQVVRCARTRAHALTPARRRNCRKTFARKPNAARKTGTCRGGSCAALAERSGSQGPTPARRRVRRPRCSRGACAEPVGRAGPWLQTLARSGGLQLEPPRTRCVNEQPAPLRAPDCPRRRSRPRSSELEQRREQLRLQARRGAGLRGACLSLRLSRRKSASTSRSCAT